MLWALILQGLAFAQAIMGYLVRGIYHFEVNTSTGQWEGNISYLALTEKGEGIVYSLLTIMHYGLDFVAQLTMLLPAVGSHTYNTMDPASMLAVPPL